jgi:cbb3-type cytochrome oxidase maturation protein
MIVIVWLLGASLLVALCGLAVFFWAVRSGQYDDLKGASVRILFDDNGLPPN